MVRFGKLRVFLVFSFILIVYGEKSELKIFVYISKMIINKYMYKNKLLKLVKF